MNQTDRDFLVDLQSSLWEEHISHDPRGLGRYFTEKEGRYLTADEMTRLVNIVERDGLPCTVGSGVFGFGFSVTVWEPSQDATYPGTETAFNPTNLVTITNRHASRLFETNDKYVFWRRVIDPLCYNDANRKRLEKNGLGPLRSQSDYDY